MITRKFTDDAGRLYSTLKEAKEANKYKYVYRVWLDQHGNVIGKQTLSCWGEAVRTIKQADELIGKECTASCI